MYCVKCGVALADTEEKCPLCNTVVYHPDLPRKPAQPLYPRGQMPAAKSLPWGALMIVTMLLFVLPISICMVCDWQFNEVINWSGYVTGALVMLYVMFVLPHWFRKAHPVIFVPVSFAAIALFLLYIDLATGGNWFMTFALPVTGFMALLTTAIVTLQRYIPKGALYTFGGGSIDSGNAPNLIDFDLFYVGPIA